MGSSTGDSMRGVLQEGEDYPVTIKGTYTDRHYSRIDYAELRNKIRSRGIEFDDTVGGHAYESDTKGLVHYHGIIRVARGRKTVRTLSFACSKGWHIHVSGPLRDGKWRAYINKHAQTHAEGVWQRESIRFINLRERFTELDSSQ